jgi:hypothetical protein
MKTEKLLNIAQASKLLGVAQSTLRRWEDEGRLIPDERTKGNQRRYRLSSLRPEIVPLKTNFSNEQVLTSLVNLIKALDLKEEVSKRLNDVSSQD